MSSPFCLAVEKFFGFLKQKHGFQLVKRGHSSVIYATKVVQVSLFYDDQRSFEVSLGLSLKNDPSQLAFSFEEMLRSLSVPSSEWPPGYAASTPEVAERILEKMSVLMNAYAASLLEGNVDSWRRIVEQRQTDCVVYAAATSVARAKRVADAAWVSHDYQKVIAALEAVEAELGKTDLARLAYARRVVTRGIRQ